VAARHRLGACIGIPIMAAAVGAVAFHRRRGGPDEDLHLDLRQTVHGITPHAFWPPTLAGELPPFPLVADNPFLLAPYAPPTPAPTWPRVSIRTWPRSGVDSSMSHPITRR